MAGQAFAAYTSLFVDVDFAVTQKAFDRGDFVQLGSKVGDAAMFQSQDYWRGTLRQKESEQQMVTAVRALGLLGDRTALEELSHAKSENPYLLSELAVAFRRLGSDEQYLATLELIQALPIKEAAYYQNRVVEYLLQTHPQRARAAWEKIEKALAGDPELQPGWVYSHATQEVRLP